MSLIDKIRLAILGPDTSVEEAEAAYIAAKKDYDQAVERKDTRGQNACLKALNVALNDMLRVHYAPGSAARSIPTEGREGPVVA